MSKLAVWIGCLSHYNAGRLVGAWYDAVTAGAVTVEQLHRDAGVRQMWDCEELWCLDLDGFPSGTSEMSPATAQRWGEAFEAVPRDQRAAFAAWIETGAHVATGSDDVPDPAAFLEHFQGEWPDFEAFADNWLEETDSFDGWPDMAKQYFDHRAFARDLALDWTVADAPGGGVFVFSNP